MPVISAGAAIGAAIGPSIGVGVVGGAAVGGAAAAVGTGLAINEAMSRDSKGYVAPTQPTFDPFAVDESAVIGASKSLRKRLASKQGLSSQSVTGGIKSTATGQKPSLFTFS